ncbi:hypothetical protein JTE90_008440 [Oedothorax gibbosus]|uniref:Uncharacterized protein n=1 Tax=Oedothorax gibbosus TaxID=931172 RepID=A0AAV6UUR5_9ARAC|nr:hypothetical protein JTE90_008440 [Oedothorax gibbosus]
MATTKSSLQLGYSALRSRKAYRNHQTSLCTKMAVTKSTLQLDSATFFLHWEVRKHTAITIPAMVQRWPSQSQPCG